MTRIAVVEDEPHTRQALVDRLQAEADLDVVLQAGTLAEARARLAECAVDVLIVDLGLPDGSGLALIDEQRRRAPATAILVLTVFGDEHKLVRAIECGARGYLLKDESSIGLVDAIGELLAGGAPLSPAIARHLIGRMQVTTATLPAAATATRAAEEPDPLTAREIEVLQLAAKGYNHTEVARLLNLSRNTVASYTRHIYEKLEVHSRAEALYEAGRLGLIERP
jgi:DNA-binding NarL/FixJ family response regulator